MLWTLEFTVAAPLADPLAAARALTAVPGLAALDAYTPARGEGDDPLNPAEVPPTLVAILSFDDEAALRAALAAPETAAAAPPGTTSAAFRRHHYPVADGPGWPLSAPVSYLVRYDLPASDVAGFQSVYMASHPPVQARLPGIRSILCDVPLPDLTVPGTANANWLMGNEVVFDSAAAFAAAMRSPARHELRAHMADFPPFSGINHHHLMDRTRMVP